MNLLKLLSGMLLALALSTNAFANTEFKGSATVNINKANAATFAAYLKGVGANKAKAIVDFRKSNGRFKSVEDLKNVPGIGDETFKDIKRKVSTSSGKSVAPEGYKMAETSGKSSKRSTKKKSSSTSSAKKESSTSKKSSIGKKSSTSKDSSTKKSSSKKSSTSKKSASKKKSSASKKSSKAKEKTKSTSSKLKSKAKKTKSKAKKKTKSKKK